MSNGFCGNKNLQGKGGLQMTCKDCIHSGLCYMENDFENFPDRCGRFIAESEIKPKGEWLADTTGAYTDNEDTWECSICHEPFTLIEGTPEDNLYYYCPKCGAKLIMKGQADD